MGYLTTCTECGKGYEEATQEDANASRRECPDCYAKFRAAVLDSPLKRHFETYEKNYRKKNPQWPQSGDGKEA